MFVRTVRRLIVNVILALAALIEYYRSLVFFMCGGCLAESPSFKHDTQARINIFSLGSVYHMWNDKDYRNENVHRTLRREVRHVSIPWTPLALSWWLYSRYSYGFFLFTVYPVACFFSAFFKKGICKFIEVPSAFRDELLHSTHWLQMWLNSYIFVSQSAISRSTKEAYELEDQIHFATAARDKKLSALGSMDDVRNVVVKRADVEGGMGIFFYENALSGGDWVIQEIPDAHATLQEIFPSHYSVPRFHVITMLPYRQDEEKSVNVKTVSVVLQIEAPFSSNYLAHQDHSVYFDISPSTCTIENGALHSRWYNTGLFSFLRFRTWQRPLPVTRIEGKTVVGTHIAEISQIIELAEKAHSLMVPKVPVASWVLQLSDQGAVVERVHFQASKWGRFTNFKFYYQTLSEWMLHYQVKRMVSETIQH